MTSRVEERKFPPKLGDPGPLLVNVLIGGIKLDGILVSTGCKDNFVSLSKLQEMGFNTDFMRGYESHVIVGGFGEGLTIVGEWEVEVLMGKHPCQVTVATTFKVVGSPFVYNAIMGRQLLCDIKAKVSVHRVEFPTPPGTGVLCKDEPKPKKREERKFPPKLGDPGPLLVNVLIGGVKLDGILVSTGCKDNFVSLSKLQEMGFKTDFLRGYESHVIVGGFGEGLTIVGEWEVEVLMGKHPCQVTVATTFKVVGSPFVYNAIMGRQLLCDIKAIVSVHRVEFPTPHGTGVLCKDEPKPKKRDDIVSLPFLY